MTQGELE